MFIPVISALVAVTLLPVVLAAFGRRLDWPRRRTDISVSRGWAAWARGVVRWRWPATAAGVGILAALAAFLPGMNTGTPAVGTLARSGPAYQGLAALHAAGVPAGALSPIEILLPHGAGPAAARRLAAAGGVWDVLTPAGASWHARGTALAVILPAAEPATGTGQATLTAIRRAVGTMPGIQVGGTAALNADFSHAVYGSAPLLLAVLAVITLAILTRAFGSLALAVKAVALSLASIAAALGATVLIWQHGYGSSALWGVPATGAVVSLIPVIVFAFLFGLSIDYEVFLVSRIREEHDRGASTPSAVATGTARTGRLITSAALILFFAFAALTGTPQTEPRMFASALGIGILLDATIVRALLAPAIIAGLGRHAWWLPRWAARALRISRAAPRAAAAGPGPQGPPERPGQSPPSVPGKSPATRTDGGGARGPRLSPPSGQPPAGGESQ